MAKWGRQSGKHLDLPREVGRFHTEVKCPDREKGNIGKNRVRETQGRGQGACSGRKAQEGLGVVFRVVPRV